jgi:geranylgeranyl pyrophosphate synthase
MNGILSIWDKDLDSKLTKRTFPIIHGWDSYDKEHILSFEEETPEDTNKVHILVTIHDATEDGYNNQNERTSLSFVKLHHLNIRTARFFN